MQSLPITIIGSNNNAKYVQCPNSARGSMTLGKGRHISKCKTGCKYFSGINNSTLSCSWVKGRRTRIPWKGVLAYKSSPYLRCDQR